VAIPTTQQGAIAHPTTLKHLTQPVLPYQRHISKLLMHCNKLATEQYLRGKIDPDYTGSIDDLPSYNAALSAYTQIGTLQGNPVPTPPSRWSVFKAWGRHKQRNRTTSMQQRIKRRRNRSVYRGFVLASEHHSLILLRGTQRRIEWLTNLLLFQTPYRDYQHSSVLTQRIDYGKVHAGFAATYRESFHPQLIPLVQHLDPSVPCYVSGHSMGGALATLAVLDLALHFPHRRSHLHLYTYASPRVGDPTFAHLHRRLIPNSYRITNVADTVPLLPPTNIGATYAHIGQPWSFLSQNGDLLPNHLIDVYRRAIDQELEAHHPSTDPHFIII
jgi:predicted lipase